MKKLITLAAIFLFVSLQGGTWDNIKHAFTKHPINTVCASTITALTLTQALVLLHAAVYDKHGSSGVAFLLRTLPVLYLSAYHFKKTVLGKHCKEECGEEES